MPRDMFDSTNIVDDPATAQVVAYYCDGRYAVAEATVRKRFPHAVLVSISAIGTNAGVVGDVEPGCMSIDYAIGWVEKRRKSGVDPTLYVNEMNTWRAAQAAFKAEGVAEPHWWVADYDGIKAIPAGAVGKQYENPTLDHGHFDKSIVVDDWPGVDPKLVVKPAPKPVPVIESPQVPGPASPTGQDVFPTPPPVEPVIKADYSFQSLLILFLTFIKKIFSKLK